MLDDAITDWPEDAPCLNEWANDEGQSDKAILDVDESEEVGDENACEQDAQDVEMVAATESPKSGAIDSVRDIECP